MALRDRRTNISFDLWCLVASRGVDIEAVEASKCHFFENWLMKHKCPNLLKRLGTMDQNKYWSFYPSEPFSFDHFTLIHPVDSSINFSDSGLEIKTAMYICV